MTHDEALQAVREAIDQVVRDKGEMPVAVHESSLLLGGDLPIDSLDLAAVVVELEKRCDHDPFKGGFIEFRTAGELASLYVR